MTSVPVSVPVFSILVDDRDDILAEQPNSERDEITAIANMVGMLGVSQSKSVDFLEAIMKGLPTMQVSYSDVDEVSISAGICFPKKSDNTQRVIRKNTSATLVTGADLDTGGPTLANSTKYYVYASGDTVATTATFKLSTNATTPSGLTIFQKIGEFMTDSSGNIIQKSVVSYAGYRVIDIQYTISGDVQGGTGAIPHDDTKPQNTEGVALSNLDTVKVCQSVDNIFIAIAIVNVHSQVGQDTALTLALFKDSDADALSVSQQIQVNNGVSGQNITLLYIANPASVNAITYKLRAGTSTSGNVTMNGAGSAREYGGAMLSGLILLELAKVGS